MNKLGIFINFWENSWDVDHIKYMKKVKVLSPAEAAMLIKDGDTVATGGFVGSGAPETLTSAVEKRFLETGEPKNITYMYAVGQGNRDGRGSDHFAHLSLIHI